MIYKLLFVVLLAFGLVSAIPQASPPGHKPWDDDHGHNQPYYPNPMHPVPGKLPLSIDEKLHYYEPHHNNDHNGAYKRSPCPAVNTLANRGFIPRSGKHTSYPAIAQASRDVFNFGDDNVSLQIRRQPTMLSDKQANPTASHEDHARPRFSILRPSQSHRS